MSKRRYKKGVNRSQGFLLPPSLEEYVSGSNPVRAIDAFVNGLDLERLGFGNARGGVQSGQPAYSPYDLLKLYLYGYLNRIQSSRRLEQETYRNVEVMWLLSHLHPSYKTIADFRKNNLDGIKAANREFVLVCKEMELFGGELVGIDGSFFNGNAGVGRVLIRKQIEKRLAKIEADIEGYLDVLSRGDQEGVESFGDDPDLAEKLERLKQRQGQCQEQLTILEDNGREQLCLTDEDARLLKKGGRSVLGYNVQTAVDAKHKLLVTSEVVTDGNDVDQLYPMAREAKDILGSKTLAAAADSGYYNQLHLKDCVKNGITPYVPIPDKSGPVRQSGRFERNEFIYDRERDMYQCPAGQMMARGPKQVKGKKELFRYSSKAGVCGRCPLRDQCLAPKAKIRQLYRWEHEDVVEDHHKRMSEHGREYMKKRAGLAEHPFGVIKIWCGWLHFLLRGLEKVRAEMSLWMLSYNFKRVLGIVGPEALIAHCLKKKVIRLEQESGSGRFYCRMLHLIALIWTHGALKQRQKWRRLERALVA